MDYYTEVEPLELDPEQSKEIVKLLNQVYLKGIEEGKRIGRAEACREHTKDLKAMKDSSTSWPNPAVSSGPRSSRRMSPGWTSRR